jgi:limonene-1,2-epoxide hydrolase
MPMEPVNGADAIRGVVEMFVNPAEEIDWEIMCTAENGNRVLNERLDKFVIGGKEVALPVMGIFDVVEGKIAVWRDYFDMATWQRQVGG